MSVTRIASYDPSIRNFAYIIEDSDTTRFVPERKKYLSLPKAQQRKYRGTMNKTIERILKRVSDNGLIVHYDKQDFADEQSENQGNKKSKKKTKQVQLTMSVRKRFLQYLDVNKAMILSCDEHVIETPFNTFGKKAMSNIAVIKMTELLVAWLLMKEVSEDNIVLVQTSAKTDVLDAPRKLSYDKRKKWAIMKGQEILQAREDDVEVMEEINTEKKKDDIYDCIVQCQAYKFLRHVAKCL